MPTSIPAAVRQTNYAPVSPTVGPFDIGFTIAAAAEIDIWADDLLLDPSAYTVTPGALSDGLYANARVTLDTAFSGDLVIIGDRSPHRDDQFTEGVGVSARDMNLSANRLEIETRENYDFRARTISRGPGDGANFDAQGRRVTDAANPTEGQDLVTKTYLETQLATASVGPVTFAFANPLTVVELAAVDHVAFKTASLIDPVRAGEFIWSASDLSAKVALDTQKGIYVPPTGLTGSTGAWVRRYDGPPRPQHFGGTDYAAVNACAQYAAREIGEMELLGAYTLTSDLVVTDSLTIRGHREKSLLDFSSKASWTNTGLVQLAGTRSTGVTLTKSVRPRTGPLPRAVSGTRSGTTITITTDIPHGLSVGDPVWHVGELNQTTPTGGQAVYFTQNSAVSANLALTLPYVVATVPFTGVYTVTCPNTGDATLTAPLYVQYASDCLFVSSTATFLAKQRVQIGSNGLRLGHGYADDVQIGEMTTVSRVISAMSMLILHAGVRDTYTTGAVAKVYPLAMAQSAVIDVTLKGKGPNVGAGAGDRGIFATFTENLLVEGCRFIDIDQMGVLTRNCINVKVAHNSIVFNAADEAGMASGLLDIQYGFADDNSEGGVWSNNYVAGGRHAWDQSGTADSTVYGIARDLIVRDNTFVGQWWSAIATHQSVEKLSVYGNNIWDAHTGINVRYCSDIDIQQNKVRATQYAVNCYAFVGGSLNISNNPRLEAGIGPIFINYAYSDDTDESIFQGPMVISHNYCVGGMKGIYVYDALNVRSGSHVEIDYNLIEGCLEEPIRVEISDPATTTTGWSGSVSHNTARRLLTPTLTHGAIRLHNAIGVQVNTNILSLPTDKFNYGVSFHDAGSVDCNVRDTRFLNGLPVINTHNASSQEYDFPLADDTVISISPPRGGGILTLGVNLDTLAAFVSTTTFITYDIGTTPAIIELIAVANIAVVTTDLTNGTGDGTDGVLTIAARSGVLKVKNRLGAAVKVSLRFLL